MTVAEPVAKPTVPSLLPPPGTLVLCFSTIATSVAQSVWGVGRVAQAFGVSLNSLSDSASLIRIGDRQVVPGGLALFTYVFPHGGWWHVLPNMTALWIFGAIAERELGTWRFVAGYFASGILGVFCYRLVVPHAAGPLAGASLAIAGLAGAYAAWRWSGRPPPASHRRIAFVLEVFLVAAVVTWLTIRVAPSTPNLLSSVMYHFIPFFGMWLGLRAYGAARKQRTGAL